MSPAELIGRLAVALPVVLLLLGGGFLAARRGWLPLPAAPGAESRLRLAGSLALAPGVRLVLVECDGRGVLLALSRAGVARIDAAPGELR